MALDTDYVYREAQRNFGTNKTLIQLLERFSPAITEEPELEKTASLFAGIITDKNLKKHIGESNYMVNKHGIRVLESRYEGNQAKKVSEIHESYLKDRVFLVHDDRDKIKDHAINKNLMGYDKCNIRNFESASYTDLCRLGIKGKHQNAFPTLWSNGGSYGLHFIIDSEIAESEKKMDFPASIVTGNRKFWKVTPIGYVQMEGRQYFDLMYNLSNDGLLENTHLSSMKFT